MSGMTTRSRRNQGPPQPNYDIPPPPSGAVLSPTSKQQGSQPGATNGGVHTGLLPTACTCVWMCLSYSSTNVHMIDTNSVRTCTLVYACAGAARPQEAQAGKLDLTKYDVVNSPFIELGSPFTAWWVQNI